MADAFNVFTKQSRRKEYFPTYCCTEFYLVTYIFSDNNVVSKLILSISFLLATYVKLGDQDEHFRTDIMCNTRIDIESCLLDIPINAILSSVTAGIAQSV